jgi:spermidine/putrescine transport system substrate-binding protein
MKVRDKLMTAKPNWISMDYANPDKYAKEDIAAGSTERRSFCTPIEQ